LSSSCFALSSSLCPFYFNHTATTQIYTLSLHDALPISFSFPAKAQTRANHKPPLSKPPTTLEGNWAGSLEAGDAVLHLENRPSRSEEHTSELQSPDHLVCRLLLEKKKT